MSVSVVMATYNGEKYIVEQLDSICSQLSTGDEVVICDDCSTDSTLDIVKAYAKNNSLQPQFRILKNETNLGFANNFKKVMDLANNDYIFFADQDDIWSQDKIAQMLEVMDKHPECEVLCCDYEPFFMKRGDKAPKAVLKGMRDDGEIEQVSFQSSNIYIGRLGCCMCITKNFRDSISKFWFDKWAQDDRCWRLALCDNGLFIYHKLLVKHRIHDKNTATYGNYHNLNKRVSLFEHMYKASKQMEDRLTDKSKEWKIAHAHSQMMKYRIHLLQKRKLRKSLMALRYIAYYQKKSSFLLELYLIKKGKMHN